MLTHRDLSNRIIGLAIEVHRNVGPGLLESVYAECLSDELGRTVFGLPMNSHAIRLKDGLRRFVMCLVSTLRAPLWCFVSFVASLARERASRNSP